MSKYTDLIFEKKGEVTRITLNRPNKHNALTISLQKQLHEAIREVKFDLETRVLIITGAGNTFCAGDDIPEMPRMAGLNVTAESLMMRRQSLPKPAALPSIATLPSATITMSFAMSGSSLPSAIV